MVNDYDSKIVANAEMLIHSRLPELSLEDFELWANYIISIQTINSEMKHKRVQVAELKDTKFTKDWSYWNYNIGVIDLMVNNSERKDILSLCHILSHCLIETNQHNSYGFKNTLVSLLSIYSYPLSCDLYYAFGMDRSGVKKP